MGHIDTYQVSAMVNGNSLDECSIVGDHNLIRPFFLNSVLNDPDIIGLSVSLQPLNGDGIRNLIRYSLQPNSTGGTADTIASSDTQSSAGPEKGAVIDTPAPSTGTGFGGSSDINSGNLTDTKGALPDNTAPTEDTGSSSTADLSGTGGSVSLENSTGTGEVSLSDTGSITQVNTPSAGTSTSGDGPASTGESISSAASTNGGGSTGTAPVDGTSLDDGEKDRKTGSATAQNTEIPEDTFSREEQKTTPVPNSDVPVVYLSQMDQYLPPFLLPEYLEIGQYSLIFQILGPLGVLNSVEKSIYFIGDAEFTMDDIRTYLPGTAEGSPIIASGLTIMLEAQINTDKRLDPYLIWYNGKKRIGEGRLSGGINRILWKVPEQSGFHALKAEAFPFKPRNTMTGAAGRTIELSLPVSTKNDKKGALPELLRKSTLTAGFGIPDDGTVRWYQCAGTLQDSMNSHNTGKDLIPGTNTAVTWMPWRNVYGLGIDSSSIYTIPGPLITLPLDATGGSGELIFRFAFPKAALAPSASGSTTLFSALFKVNGSSELLSLELSYTEDELRLAYGTENASRKESIGFPGRRDFITAILNFTFTENQFSAGLRLGNGDLDFPPLAEDWTSTHEPLTLPGPLNGQGTFRLGGVPRKAWEGVDREVSKKQIKPAVTILLDDFTVLFVPQFLKTEEIPVVEPEEAVSGASVPKDQAGDDGHVDLPESVSQTSIKKDDSQPDTTPKVRDQKDEPKPEPDETKQPDTEVSASAPDEKTALEDEKAKPVTVEPKATQDQRETAMDSDSV